MAIKRFKPTSPGGGFNGIHFGEVTKRNRKIALAPLQKSGRNVYGRICVRHPRRAISANTG